METTVTKTWKPTVAGVLNIVAGVSSLLGVLGVIVAIIFVGSGPLFWDSFPGLGPLTVGFLEGVLVITAVFLAVVGILPLLDSTRISILNAFQNSAIIFLFLSINYMERRRQCQSQSSTTPKACALIK